MSYTSNDLGITEAKGGAVITSVLLIGAAIGGFFAGQLADLIGPCKALQWNNAALLAGTLLSAAAPRGSVGFWAMLLGGSRGCEQPRATGVCAVEAQTRSAARAH